ncbi:ABC transporter ATP-binding protein [Burkholderia vietnamiensis]|uniref:ABC transporter ATP-binding protein n=1 Tax=Burkholderia vietnamiensis TaxID=60552 RepID=UPI0009BC9D34|nr:ATP-binding cassette domain-containing protein [Burkholderia vietnamiensis]CAG9222999.1 ABC-2 type transport system ATP-binding protein [Burkholderia vietnamiensis]
MNVSTQQSSITARGLSKKFGDRVVLDEVELTVRPGEMFALLGPNGAGKTTFFSILSTLRKPTSGTLEVHGRDVVEERAWVRRHIGIVFQEPALADILSVRKNLNLMTHFYGLPRAIARQRTEDILASLELTDVADRPARQLSGGQRRRLELARALIADPALLCLDEATLGLDLNARRLFWSKVRELANAGKTIFFTTHYMEEADVADRIALIDKGRIIAIDTPQALKAQVGGGIIQLSTDNDALAHDWLVEGGYAVDSNESGLCITGKNLSNMVPDLVRDLPARVEKVEVREPSLEDVFLLLTGHSLVNGQKIDKKNVKEGLVA